MESPKPPPSPAASLGRADKEGPRVTGRTGVGADVDLDLNSEVFGQVEIVLREFSNLVSVVNQLLQQLVCDFRIASAVVQTEQAQHTALD